MTAKIELGDEVRCKYTGFKGIVVAKTEFINGCIQFNVLPKMVKGKNAIEGYPEDIGIDEDSLEVMRKGKKKVSKKRVKIAGGRARQVQPMRGY